MADEIAAPITWTDVLETGIPELDAEHRALIELCNRLIGLIQGGGTWGEVVAAARDLAAACYTHFRNEESLLDRHDFPRIERHRAQHRELERRFGELVGFISGADGTDEEHRKAALTVRATLIDVLFRHDLDYKSHLQNVAGR